MRKSYFLLLLLTLLVACSDSGSLGSAYYISKADSGHVYIWKKNGGKSIVVVKEQVVDWRKIDGFLVVLRKVAVSPDCYDRSGLATIITHYSDESQYWLVDLKRRYEFGPYDEDKYRSMLKKIGLPDVKLKVPADYSSNSKQFEKRASECRNMTSP